MNNASDKEYRVIRTGLFSKKALEILQSVDGQLSDGMWENSPKMEKYWRFSNMATAPDGEVLIQIDVRTGISDRYSRSCRWISNGFCQMSDDEVKSWYAAKAKHVMKTEINDDMKNDKAASDKPDYYKWDRKNVKFETVYLSNDEPITISDVYFVYEFLSGRQVDGKYPAERIAEMTVRTTAEKELRREKIKALDDAYLSDRKTVEDWKTAEIAKIQKKADDRIKALYAQYVKDKKNA